jgi:adenylylsulfate kinase-like enzyme
VIGGNVVLFNGTSSSGKSTIAALDCLELELQRRELKRGQLAEC